MGPTNSLSERKRKSMFTVEQPVDTLTKSQTYTNNGTNWHMAPADAPRGTQNQLCNFPVEKYSTRI